MAVVRAVCGPRQEERGLKSAALPKRPRQVCVKVEDLNWDSKDVSGAVYAGVEVKALGKKEVKFWKITSFSIPV